MLRRTHFETDPMRRSLPWLFAVAALAAIPPALVALPSSAQQPAASAPAPAAAPSVRLRGTIAAVDADGLTLKERSGETIRLVYASTFAVNEIVPVELASIRSDAYVGIASMPQSDGTQRALEVLVFPEDARGSGEGSYDWDLQPGSRMTNATVAELAAAPDGRTLKLKYKGGEQTVVVPQGVPVVTIRPSDRSLLVPGAQVFVSAQVRDGRPTALRALAGRNGVVPPM